MHHGQPNVKQKHEHCRPASGFSEACRLLGILADMATGCKLTILAADVVYITAPQTTRSRVIY